MTLRLLNPQGIAGIAASLCLGLLLILQKGETRHWKKQSGQFEQMYRDEQSALAGTVANYRAAADRARAADLANIERVKAEQSTINERISDDFEKRLAAARAAAANISSGRLRIEAGSTAADPGVGGNTSVPGLAASTGQSHEVTGQDRLPDALLATEQAIQLDELIKWLKAQSEVDANGDRN
jgi:hypothetical protein